MKQGPNYSNQRVGIFVDVQNLYHSAKNLYQGRVNYAELIKHLTDGRQLIRAMAYVVKSEGIVEPSRPATVGRTLSPKTRPLRSPTGGDLSSEAAFFDALKDAGLELRMKDLQIYAGGMKKADWDVGMAVDAIRLAPSLDVVILVTGDGDFLPLIDYLRWGSGLVVEVSAFRRSASLKIQEVADRFINIETIPRAIMRSR